MKKLTGPTLYAWLAALIDGEGSVMLNLRTYSGNGKQIKKRQPHYRAVVSICNTNPLLLEELVKQTKVNAIYCHRVGGDVRAPRKRTSWTWRLNNGEIQKWLPLVRPYLVLKGKQADLLLEALALKHEITPGNPGFFPAARAILITRLHEIYAEIRQLNTTGRTPLTEDSNDAKRFARKGKNVIRARRTVRVVR